MRQPRISALEDHEFDNVEIATLRRIASAFDVALVVQFVPFSQVVRNATSMKPSDISVPEFSMDALTSVGVMHSRGMEKYWAIDSVLLHIPPASRVASERLEVPLWGIPGISTSQIPLQ